MHPQESQLCDGQLTSIDLHHWIYIDIGVIEFRKWLSSFYAQASGGGQGRAQRAWLDCGVDRDPHTHLSGLRDPH